MQCSKPMLPFGDDGRSDKSSTQMFLWRCPVVEVIKQT